MSQPLRVTTTEGGGYISRLGRAGLLCLVSQLARQTLEKKASNLPSVTGAKKTAILGEVYWA